MSLSSRSSRSRGSRAPPSTAYRYHCVGTSEVQNLSVTPQIVTSARACPAVAFPVCSQTTSCQISSRRVFLRNTTAGISDRICIEDYHTFGLGRDRKFHVCSNFPCEIVFLRNTRPDEIRIMCDHASLEIWICLMLTCIKEKQRLGRAARAGGGWIWAQ